MKLGTVLFIETALAIGVIVASIVGLYLLVVDIIDRRRNRK